MSPQIERRSLVVAVAALALLAITAPALLVFGVLPRFFASANEAIIESGHIADIEAVVSKQVADGQAYVLDRDPAHAAAFQRDQADFERLTRELRPQLSATEIALLGAGERAHAGLVASQDRLVVAMQRGAFAAARAALADVVADADAAQQGFGVLHERSQAESHRDLNRAHARAQQLTLLLLGLSFVPAAAAFAVGRAMHRLRVERAGSADRERLAEAQRVAHIGSWQNDLRTGEVTWSDELYRILGYDKDVPASLDRLIDVIHPDERDDLVAQLARGVDAGRTFEFVNRIVRPDGELRWLQSQGEFLLNSAGEPVSVVGIGHDVTERMAAAAGVRDAEAKLVRQEAAMRHRAYHDDLTGLPNRRLLLERLDDALRDGHRPAVLLIDLDGFKRINDSLGHGVGDTLLVNLGQRMSIGMRGCVSDDDNDAVAVARGTATGVVGGRDRTPDVVARLGGDEFAVLLVDADTRQAAAVAERLLHACAQPFDIDGRQLTVSASIGVALSERDVTSAELLRNADVAMYRGKENGGSRQTLFDPEMHAAVMERLALEAELRDAIAHDGLALHYQPIVDPRTGEVHKIEALVRWPHPTRGMLAPDRFIPLAEETGLIVPMGAWVIAEACRELRRLSATNPDLRVAVNLSARQLDDPDLVASVTRSLAAAGVEAGALVLEVTESVVMEQDPSAFGALEQLRDLGITLAIDDFGTGYSSLSRLRHIPAGWLKIDKSFIDEVDDEEGRAPVIAAVIALAHSLHMSVVAEGVETAAQLVALERLGCDHVQGFLFSRPLPPDELARLLAAPSPFAGFVAPERSSMAKDVESALLATVAHAIEDERDLDGVVRPLLEELSRLTGLESTYLTAVDLDAQVQQVLVAHNADPRLEVPENLTVEWRETLCRRALTDGPRASSNVAGDFPGNDAAAALGLRAFAVSAVTTPDGTLLGTLCGASTTKRAVGASTLSLMDLFAQLVSDALRNHVSDKVTI